MRIALFVLLAVVASTLAAQDFKPYPRAEITTAQWQSYFDKVKSIHAATAKNFPSEHLSVLFDSSTATSYAFTQPGHPAHPA